MRKLAHQQISKSANHLLIFSFANLLIFFSSCALDTDDAYYPVTKQQFLLVGDAQRNLLHIQQGEVNDDWLSQQGWAAQVNDMDVSGDIFWFASGQSQELFRWDAATGENQIFSTSPFQPHAIVAGDRFLTLVDSVNQKLGFWDPETASFLIDMPWESEIGDALYISGKYFLQKGKRKIEVLLESNLQTAAEISFEKDILNIQLSPSLSLYVLTADSLVYEQTISYFSYTPAIYSRRLGSYDGIKITPYLRAQYGKEWLGNIWEQNQNLFNRNPNFLIINDVTNYVVDFFESQLFFQRNDSLYSHDIREATTQYLYPLPLPIQKYRAFRQPIGQ
jgi:hypothetical protein